MIEKITSILQDFFGQKPIREGDNIFIITLGPPTKAFKMIIRIASDKIVAENVLPEASEEVINYLRRRISEEKITIKLFIHNETRNLSIEMPYKRDILESIKAFLVVLKKLYQIVIDHFPHLAWRILGEIKIRIMNEEITVLSPEYEEPRKTGWRSDLIAILPGEDGWFKSVLGLDNVFFPFLFFLKDSEIYAYKPSPNGQLIPINLSEILKKLKQISEKLHHYGITLPENETEVFINFEKIPNAISMLKMIRDGSIFPLSFTKISTVDKENLDHMIRELEKIYEELAKVRNIEHFIKLRVLIRMAVLLAKNAIQRGGAGRVLISNVRKVSKLGAGKAVYIGKEELKYIRLGEKVLVSVVDEEGRRRIIIEPI